jgi:AraC-like DNA-binding protein
MHAGRIIRVAQGELPGGTWQSVRANPHPELAAYVREYQGYLEASSQIIRRRELPSGDVALIISFGPRYALIDPLSGVPLATRGTFIAGLDDTYSLVDSSGAGAAMQIDFTPIGAYQILQTPMHLLSHRTTELSDVLGRKADRLVEQLFEAPDWHCRFDIVDAFLRSRILPTTEVSREINWAWHQLNDSHGMLPIAEITNALGWTRKRLVRTFRNHIGVPPKMLARILRFRHALTELGSRKVINAARVAVESGYSDQAHMIKEFSTLSGSTPGELLRCYSADGGIVEA